MRRNVPIIDAAIDKLVRFAGGFSVKCRNAYEQAVIDDFMRNVRVGASGRGMECFVRAYLDSLLTYGNAVGEICLDNTGNIGALYLAKLTDVSVKRGDNPFQTRICAVRGLEAIPVKNPELVMFTAFNPPPGEVKGVSILQSLPFVTSILVTIMRSVGQNFERAGNVRYCVTYRPSDGSDRAQAATIAQSIASQWQSAMEASSGTVKDFVAVGDVQVKAIGADGQTLNCDVPVRQLMEQIVARLGVPPFMLGLHWSSTERMSKQQADMLTSEIDTYRRLVEPVIEKILTMRLRLEGMGGTFEIDWSDVNLQDEIDAAAVRLSNAQSAKLEQEVTNADKYGN
jgi:hypothetical protein